MKRVQVNNPLEGATPRVRPPGGPGDIFTPVQATRPAPDNSLADLGNALGGLNTVLTDAFVEDNEIMDEKEIAAGKLAFHKDQKKSLAAIRSGQVPAGMTPHHQRGVRLEALKVLAGRFGDQLRLGHVQDGINSSEDPEVFDAFVAQKRAEFIESELQVFDPLEIEEVFSARADAQVGALRNNHMIGLIKSYEREAVIQLDASTRDTITQALGAGDRSLDATVNDALSPETGLDAAKIGKVLTENISTDNFHSLVASGMDPRIAGKTVRDAVISLVEEEGDTDVLKILDHVDTGHGPLSNTTAHKNKIEAAIDRINSENNTAFKFQQAQADRRRKVTARRLQGNGMLALERSRTAPCRAQVPRPDRRTESRGKRSTPGRHKSL